MSIGHKIIDAIVTGGLMHSDCVVDKDHNCLCVWSSAAADQISAIVEAEIEARTTKGDTTMPEKFEDKANRLRAELKAIEKEVRTMMDDERFKQEQTFPNQHGEVKANVMLAVRHIEDARMRLGKAIQYCGDGVSCYDK